MCEANALPLTPQQTALNAVCKVFVDSSGVSPMANYAVSNLAVTYSLLVGTSLVNSRYSNWPNILP